MEVKETAAHSIGRGFDLRGDNEDKGYNKGYYWYWRGVHSLFVSAQMMYVVLLLQWLKP